MSVCLCVVRFPLITVRSMKVEGLTATLELDQQWFIADGSFDPVKDTAKWLVPLIIGTPASTAKPSLNLMHDKTATVTVQLASEKDWIKINAGQTAMIRVNYTPEMRQRLAEAVRTKAIPPQDRGALLGDAYALSRAGLLPLKDVVSVHNF